MNRITSSSNAQTKKLSHSKSQSQSQPKSPEKKERNLKRERFPANPLRGSSTRSSGSRSGSNVGDSVLSSGEASNGCHRFLLSHSFSSSSSTSSSLGVFHRGGSSNRPVKSVAKTPKSAPVVSKPLIRKKPKSLEEIKLKSTVTEKPNLLKSHRCKPNPTSGKRPTGKIITKPVLKKQSSVSREVTRVDDSIAQVTPVSKLGNGSDLIYRSNGEARDNGRLSSNSNSSYQERTPPVQASVSPELQFGGSSMSLSASAKSQACYAAGHLLSGVSDKRKCKPKGLLTVGEDGFVVGKGKILLSDSDEFDGGDFGNDISLMPLPADASVHWLLSPCDEEKEKTVDGFSQLQQSFECVSHETPSPVSDCSLSSDLCNISSGKSLSPMRRTSSSLSPKELSRFRRFIDLSSSIDVTPTRELGPFEHLKGDKPSPLSADTLGSENVIQTPESNSSFDNYNGLSCSQAEIQVESLTTVLQSARLSPTSPQEPSSSSFNFDSFPTSSDSIDLSQFQRLVDRKSRHSHVTEFDTRNRKGSDALPGKDRELLTCSVAESISTDGGGLICSEDSNWMACYKN